MFPLCLFKCHDFKKYSLSFPCLFKLEKSLSEDHCIKNSDDTSVTKDPWGLLFKSLPMQSILSYFQFCKILLCFLRKQVISTDLLTLNSLSTWGFSVHSLIDNLWVFKVSYQFFSLFCFILRKYNTHWSHSANIVFTA